MSDTTAIAPARRFQCRHIHTDGRRCGSPSLREQDLCYFHQTARSAVSKPRRRRHRQAAFDLPLPEDRSAIQLSIGEVIRRVASNDVDPRRAGLLLYGLQIASNNLPRTNITPGSQPIEDIVIDPVLGTLAPAAELGEDPRSAYHKTLTERLFEQLSRAPGPLSDEEYERRHSIPPPAPAF